eukprot:1936150-Amphidinium_carterae.1
MVLNQLGLEPAITEFQQEYIRPMQEFLYGAEGDGTPFNKDNNKGYNVAWYFHWLSEPSM